MPASDDPSSGGSAPTGDPYRALVRAIQRAAGEEREELFYFLYAAFDERLIGLFRRRGFTRAEAEELTHDTLFRVFQKIEEFRGDASVTTWVFRIAKNLAANERRDRKTLKRGAPEVSLEAEVAEHGEVEPLAAPAGSVFGDPASAPDAAVLEHEDTRLLWVALDELPPQQRRCVQLLLGHDLKYREIAAVIGVTTEAVKTHLHLARKRLAPLLAEHFQGAGFEHRGSP